MRILKLSIVAAGIFVIAAVGFRATAQSGTSRTTAIPLNDLKTQHPRNVKTELGMYKGRQAVQVTDMTRSDVQDGVQLVILDNTQFRDGTIEIEMAGEPKPGAENTAARGFVGLAFRLNIDPGSDAPKYDCFYIRPTNGRADDQVRRNHATQYISFPDRPWFKLREQFPGKYESYADMVAGEWTKVKIEVMGTRANLYVGSAPQPVLVVNDLKQEDGQIALWVGTDTIARFTNLRINRVTQPTGTAGSK